MMSGEVRAKEQETQINRLEISAKNQSEVIVEVKEVKSSVNKRIASNLRVKKRFSRPKQSLGRKSLII